MRYLKVFLVITPVMFLVGCAANIKYSMKDKNLYTRQNPLNYRVAIDILEDSRPTEECNGSLRKITGIEVLCTKNKDFKPNVDRQISMMLVEHLNKARIFRLAELRDISNNLDLSPQEIQG